MTDDDGDSAPRLRTLCVTYAAADADAEVFMVVLGSVAENFRGVELHEFADDTVFDDAEDRGAVEALYERLTAEGRLGEEQRAQLEGFAEQIRAWERGEGG